MSGLAVPGRGNPGPWIGRVRRGVPRPRLQLASVKKELKKVNPPLLAGALRARAAESRL